MANSKRWSARHLAKLSPQQSGRPPRSVGTERLYGQRQQASPRKARHLNILICRLYGELNGDLGGWKAVVDGVEKPFSPTANDEVEGSVLLTVSDLSDGLHTLSMKNSLVGNDSTLALTAVSISEQTLALDIDMRTSRL